jgi:hypothetical protein
MTNGDDSLLDGTVTTLPDMNWTAKEGHSIDVLDVVAICLFQNRTQEQGPLQTSWYSLEHSG